MIRIYQLYYKEEQKQFLNPLYYHYDNTINLNPNDREYPLLKECYQISKKDNINLWGAVSWNYKFKFSSGNVIPDDFLLNHIHNNPGYDVYFFNPFTNHVPVIYNVWEQGQWCHPHMISIMEHIFPLMDVDVKNLYKPQSDKTIFFGSMCVASNEFWDEYFNFANMFVYATKNLPLEIKTLYESDAGYLNTGINYFSFIQERLMSTFLSLKQDSFKILPYHINESSMDEKLMYLNNLKRISLSENNKEKIELWARLRTNSKKTIYPEENIDWSTLWIDKYFNS